ncbi:riboflavin synthase, partial [Calditrichota bacterium]
MSENLQLSISASKISGVDVGDSVAVNGPCLTVIRQSSNDFTVEASGYTLTQSTLGKLSTGDRVNLERALQLGDRLGGHMVQGHVDAVARVMQVRKQSGYTDLVIDIPSEIKNFLVSKGSICLNGVSLTIAEKLKDRFRVMVIPHTLANTTLGELKPGNHINIE